MPGASQTAAHQFSPPRGSDSGHRLGRKHLHLLNRLTGLTLKAEVKYITI